MAYHSPQQTVVPRIATVDIDVADGPAHDSPSSWQEKPLTANTTYGGNWQESPQRIAVNDEPRLTAIDKLTMATQVSIRYHQRRKRHYDGIYKAMVLGLLLVGCGALVANFDQWRWVAFAVVGLSSMLLVWNVGQKGREHELLISQYQNLLDQVRQKQQPDMTDLHHWRSLRVNIQAKEPPIYWAVANDCYYDVARAWDLRPQRRHQLPLLLRPLVNWIRF